MTSTVFVKFLNIQSHILSMLESPLSPRPEISPLKKKIVLSVLGLILVAVLILCAMYVFRPAPSKILPTENQRIVRDFRITMALRDNRPRDNELLVGEVYATIYTGIRIEPLVENFLGNVKLEYSPRIQGLTIEFSPSSGVPPFDSEVIVSASPDFPDNLLWIPIIVKITGTSQENISRSISIEVTVGA
jgi:hypothetical protein